jgi:hypothetical protein
MTNASAMTLTLLLFLALFLAAMFVIFFGGTLFVRRERPARRAPRHTHDHHQPAA